ncbi:iron dicitrate transport regulator FecR [Duganella sp. FT92W]|uniref:Iron dicitrate transport regulator FecR n=1 Tax=Pseudoduganella rivuli TaxID=2666085 RepID=A0A7X2IRX0_9BURK|nr:FecR domain-containing protein [Pseudoduganella rivuli]MRV74980.1 iron dicitrate transport regulator FecR [Pseudoduganella rivuli]
MAVLALAAAIPAQGATVAGTVTQLSGAATASRPDGVVRQLALKSEVASGEVLTTARDSYAMVKFIDDSEVVLKPVTTLAIDHFVFEHGKPADDSAGLRLLRGGMRSVTGLLGKRNKEKFTLHTPSATIGIRGTTFFLEYLTGGTDGAAASPLDPGLHVYVSEGGISLTNQAGFFQYDPGQYGYIRDDKTKPAKMFANPGMRFDLPPAFGASGLPEAKP